MSLAQETNLPAEIGRVIGFIENPIYDACLVNAALAALLPAWRRALNAWSAHGAID